jgi:hypothetical protein
LFETNQDQQWFDETWFKECSKFTGGGGLMV